jgi:hypothetical protein
MIAKKFKHSVKQPRKADKLPKALAKTWAQILSDTSNLPATQQTVSFLSFRKISSQNYLCWKMSTLLSLVKDSRSQPCLPSSWKVLSGNPWFSY